MVDLSVAPWEDESLSDIVTDFKDIFAIQVERRLFGYRHSRDQALFEFRVVNKNQIKCSIKAEPILKRYAPSLVNYADEFIFISGG